MENVREIWIDIEKLDSLYRISNFGNVKSIRRKKLKPMQDNGKGYKQLYVQIKNKRFVFYIHRLVAEAFIPNPSNKPHINHKNGIKSDNRVDNLEWVTQSENLKHAVNKNLIKSGQDSKKSKLSESKVIAIKRLYKINPRFNRSHVANKLGVRDTTIIKIITGKRWKHLL